MAVMTTDRIAWAAENVVYRDTGRGSVYAFWTPHPGKLDDLKNGSIRDLLYDDAVRHMATARRFYKSEGAEFSGWAIESGSDSTGIVQMTKSEAIEQLRFVIADRFNRA